MSMIIAAMPAHNEEGTIAKVVLGAKKHVDSVVVSGRWQYRFNCGNRGRIRRAGCTARRE